MKQHLARLLALAILFTMAPAWAQQPPKGKLVIIGGALREDNAEVWERIVSLAGGKGARIAVFPSAAGNPERSGRTAAAVLERYGARPFVVPLSERLPGTEVRKVAEDPALAAAVRAAGGAYFVGGDQGRITGALRRPDGGNSALLDAVWDLYRRGGVIAGTSAGAAIMSKTMFFEGQDPLPTLKGGITPGRDIAPGLGFIGDEVFIDQHLLVRGRFARMLPAMLASGHRVGLGVDENTALVVDPERQVSVIGYKGALLLDLSQATSDPARPAFNLSGARISYLDRGTRYDLASGTVSPGPYMEPVDPARPYYQGPLFFPDILANTTVADLLERLADSDQQSAVGLAFGGPASPQAARGFEFTFTKTPATQAWGSTRAEAYTVHRVRLDVQPVRLNQPLYRHD